MSDLFKLDEDDETVFDEDETSEEEIIPSLHQLTLNESPPTKLPAYPLCQKLVGAEREDECYLTCVSVFRHLYSNPPSLSYMRNRCRKHATKEKGFVLTKQKPNWIWHNRVWEPCLSEKEDWMVKVSELQAFLTWALQRIRKTETEKLRLFKQFNFELSPEEKEHIKVPIEIECLELLEACLPYVMEKQYRVGKYRLDAFIPRLRIGIEIDEHGHRNYQKTEEKEYNTVLRDHNIVCIRFDPHAKYLYPPATELVRRLWARTLSPDFVSFREKHKLV